MSDVFSIFMPGRAHWEEYKQAEKMLLVESKKGGEGPQPVDLDEGTWVMRDRTGTATQTSIDIGNPNRVRPEPEPEDQANRTAAQDISTPTGDDDE